MNRLEKNERKGRLTACGCQDRARGARKRHELVMGRTLYITVEEMGQQIQKSCDNEGCEPQLNWGGMIRVFRGTRRHRSVSETEHIDAVDKRTVRGLKLLRARRRFYSASLWRPSQFSRDNG